MRKLLLMFVTLLLLAVAGESHAIRCTKAPNIYEETRTISTAIAVANTLPKNSILWRSEPQSFVLNCWADFRTNGEYVYIYLDPRNSLGANLEMGVGFNGQDLRCSQLSGCKAQTAIYVPACASDAPGCPSRVISYTVNYTLFVSKKSEPSANQEGPLTTINSLTALQFDGVGGININPSYHLILSGMNQFRYIGCASQVSIVPSTINFGSIGASGARANTEIGERTFSVNTSKTCNSVYGLNGYLTPTGGTLTDTNTTLVPSNNTSVGIQLFDAQSAPVAFLKEFELVAPTSQLTASKSFTAKLKWMRDTPTLGAFNAGATLDIFYK